MVRASCYRLTLDDVGFILQFYMGPIHPRDKKPVGLRLAQASMSVAYGANTPYTGPTIAGCSVNTAANSITLTFNKTLLSDDSIEVRTCVCVCVFVASGLSEMWLGSTGCVFCAS